MRKALAPLQVAAENVEVDAPGKKIVVRVPKDFDTQKVIDTLGGAYPGIKEIKTSS